MIALEAIFDFAKTEEINTSRMVMHIVDDNKKIDTFRLTQVFAVFNLILDSYWSKNIENFEFRKIRFEFRKKSFLTYNIFNRSRGRFV